MLLIGIPLTPLLVLSIWYVNIRASNSAAIRKLEQEVRQRGEPLTLSELGTNYVLIPDSENVAVALMEIWKEDDPEFWTAVERGDNVLPDWRPIVHDPALPYLGTDARNIPRDKPLSPHSLAAANAFLSTNAARLQAVRVAFRRPHFYFFANVLPHLPLLKREAERFQIMALVAAERGDVNESIQPLHDTARAGQILAGEPIPLSQLVRLSCLEMAIGGAEQLLSRRSLRDDDLNQLQALLENLHLRGAAKSYLIFERPFSLDNFNPMVVGQKFSSASTEETVEDAERAASGVRKSYRAIRALGYFDPDRILMLETFKQAIILAEQETPSSLAKYTELFDQAEASARKFPPKFISSLMLPAVRNIPTRFASYEARRRAALAAIAIERFRLAHGSKLPEQLTALVPQFLASLPLDPFNGEPLRFKKTDGGFVVYSVGKDLTDDDGLERPRRASDNRDVTFTVQWSSLSVPTPPPR